MDILILADGGPSIGGGHLSRCRALAKAMENLGHKVLLACPEKAGGTLPDFKSQGFLDFIETSGLLQGISLAVLDTYGLAMDDLDRLRSRVKLLVLDDFREFPVEAHSDLVLNYNVLAEELPYRGLCPLILGPDYALLRSSFKFLEASEGQTVLFAAGSSDLERSVLKLVNWYDASWPPLKAVLGPLTDEAYRNQVQKDALGKKGLEVLCSPLNFDRLLAEAKTVVTTSSVTAYEALALGKATLVFQAAENQRRIGSVLSRLGWALDLGWFKDLGEKDLKEALKRAFPPPSGVIPKDGADRAARKITEVLS